MSFLVLLVISIVLSLAAYLLAPKPKYSDASTAASLNAPTVSAGRPIPVVFGTVTIKMPNILWFGDKRIHEYKVNV